MDTTGAGTVSPVPRYSPLLRMASLGDAGHDQALGHLADLDAGHLPALGRVDDRHVVAQHVADAAVLAVGAERQPGRPLARADRADDLLSGRVVNVHGVGAATRGPKLLLVGRQ